MRAEGERPITESGILATFVRPRYVLGPGRSWPIMLKPFYALTLAHPPTREGAIRLALVTLEQMTQTLASAVENRRRGAGIRAAADQDGRKGVRRMGA